MLPVTLRTIACVGCLTSFAHSENWTAYRGNAGDGKSSASVRWQNEGVKALPVLWKVDCPLGFSSFAIDGDRCVTVISEDGSEKCVAYSVQDGSILWKCPLGSSELAQGGGNSGAPDNRGGDGPRSTPTIAGDTIVVYGTHMVLWGIDRQTGEVRWSVDVPKTHDGRTIKWENASSPVVVDGQAIIAGGGAGQSFLAVSVHDGSVVWKSGDETMTHATPTVATIRGQRQVIFLVQSGLVSLDPANGKELWRAKFPFSTSTAASPVVAGNLVYCSAGYGVGAGLFEINSNGQPEEVWFKANELMNHWSTPVAHDGALFGLFEFKKYGKAPLQCVDLDSGEILWKERGFGPGNCILIGDTLAVLSDAGEVALVKATREGYAEWVREDVLSGKCWSTPAFADGKLFVRSTEQAACIDLSGR